MKKYEFMVVFPDQDICVYAFNKEEALILVQADRITCGKTYKNYIKVVEVNDND